MTGKPPPPHIGPSFDAMMLEIDAKLAAEGCPIAHRPMHAGREISVRYGIPMPIAVTDVSRLPPELRPYAPLSIAITRWYDESYGDRLKIDMSPGRTVVRLDGDLYVVRTPRLLGSAEFHVSREFTPQPTCGRGPLRCNILQLVEGLTKAKAARLPDEGLTQVASAFTTALHACYTLEATPHVLLQSARSDMTCAVTALMGRTERAGESKWASLQAAEKTLKAAISLQGEEFAFTHNLTRLAGSLRDLGVAPDVEPLLAAIQCTPGIRYGEEACSQQEALDAHQASLSLVNALSEAGARFNPGLG
jgi:HEPN domain-containing protein